jgi:hypothetical protein
MLQLIPKAEGGMEPSLRDPVSASALLDELRAADPATALTELGAWLESLKGAAGSDDGSASEVLSLVQEAGTPHVSALLTHYFGDIAEKPISREAEWKALFGYASSLAEATCGCAQRLTVAARQDPATLNAAAGCAVRGLRACRTLAKVCFIHYFDVPSSLWRLAYAVHAGAEQAGCAATTVYPHPSQKTATTVTQELLRLLMLQVSAPEMLAPEQIEVADRVAQQLGTDFILRPPSVADNPFCFAPGGDRAPQRAPGQASAEGPAMRGFGPGTGLDALARLHKQMRLTGSSDIKAFGKDIAPHAQLAAIEHLLHYWAATPPRAPHTHSRANGDLLIVHRYAQIAQRLADAESAAAGVRELAITSSDGAAAQPPEEWALRDVGGSELGADIPHLSGSWAKCGELVGVCVGATREWWLGTIRRMHAEPGKTLHADIAVFSRKPSNVCLRVLETGRTSTTGVESALASIGYNDVQGIMLRDVPPEAVGRPRLLLPLDGWKPERAYQVIAGEPARCLRVLQVLKRGPDYVGVSFEWIATPDH